MHPAAEAQDSGAAAEHQQHDRVEAELADEDLDRMMAERVSIPIGFGFWTCIMFRLLYRCLMAKWHLWLESIGIFSSAFNV